MLFSKRVARIDGINFSYIHDSPVLNTIKTLPPIITNIRSGLSTSTNKTLKPCETYLRRTSTCFKVNAYQNPKNQEIAIDISKGWHEGWHELLNSPGEYAWNFDSRLRGKYEE